MVLPVVGDDVRIDMGALLGAVWARKIRVVLVTVILLALVYVLLMFVPRMYESSASILVEARDNTYIRAANDVSNGAGVADEAAIASQIELIKSRETLLKVIEDENLEEVPEFNGSQTSPLGLVFRLLGRSSSTRNPEDAALANVRQRLTVIQQRDSRVISVTFQSQDPQLAARIANAIATTHVERRAGLVASDTADASRWLEQEIDKLRVRVSEAEKEVAQFRVQNDLLTEQAGSSLLDQQLSSVSSQISAAQERRDNAASRANLIRELLQQGQSLDGVPDVRDSVVVQRLAEEKGRLQGERAQLLATLLRDHPNVRAITAQIAEVDAQIRTEGRQVAEALEAEARIEADLVGSLRDELARLKLEASNATTDTVTLNELEREAAAQRELLETYLRRYRDASSRTEAGAALPDVRVVAYAAPTMSPSSPRTSLILVAVTVVSVATQVGWILFAELSSGRAIAEAASFSQWRPAEEDDSEDAGKHEGPGEADKAEADYADDADYAEARTVEERLEEYELATEHAATIPEPPLISLAFDNKPLAAISADIAIGHERMIVVGSTMGRPAAAALCDTLVEDAHRRGISVAYIDAGSAVASDDYGLTDLCAGDVDFGDVVHRIDADLAEVPWGRREVLDRHSSHAHTLQRALADIYETVIVNAGTTGTVSPLPLFADIKASVLLVVPAETTEEERATLVAEGKALGFARCLVVGASEPSAKVA